MTDDYVQVWSNRSEQWMSIRASYLRYCIQDLSCTLCRDKNRWRERGALVEHMIASHLYDAPAEWHDTVRRLAVEVATAEAFAEPPTLEECFVGKRRKLQSNN